MTMIIVSILTTLIHLFIIVRSVIFFRTSGEVRESDKTAVATIALLSVMFIMAMALAWLEHPPLVFSRQLSGAMFTGFNLAVAVVFLGQVRMVTTRRAEHACHQS